MLYFLYIEKSRNEYHQRIESLKKAWLLVKQDLKTHGITVQNACVLSLGSIV